MSTFVPQYSLISDITLGDTTTITFTDDHDFIVGEIISIRVSPQSGTSQLNNTHAPIISLTSDSITIDIDSNNFTPFISLSMNEQVQVAMVVPLGSGLTPDSYSPTISLQAAFDNQP